MLFNEKYFKNLDRGLLDKIYSYYDFLNYWNQKINLISRKDIDNFYLHHFVHSASIYKFYQFKDGTKFIDVGSGGGFPGLPLAILNNNLQFTLVDSINKKTIFLKNAVKELKLDNVKIERCRMEYFEQKCDFVIGRAVSNITTFYNLTYKNISNYNNNNIKNGIIYLTGGDVQKDIDSYQGVVVNSINSVFDEDYFFDKKIIFIPKQ